MKITRSNFDEIKQNYRIKTKEEFEDEFGKNWRFTVPYNFIRDMDYLLGKPLSKIKGLTFFREGILDIDDYSIGPEMLVEIDFIKIYNKSIAGDKDTSKCLFKIVK